MSESIPELKLPGKCNKCTCRLRRIENWRVIRVQGNDWIVACRICKQAWHTSAQYASELTRDIVTPYRWRQMFTAGGYKLHEDAPSDAE